MRYLLLTFGLLFTGVSCSGEPAETSTIPAARAALTAGDIAEARKLVATISADDPDWGEAQLLLAEIAMSLEGIEGALVYLQAVPRDGSEVSLTSALAAAEIENSTGQLSRAIESYDYLLQHQPKFHEARTELAFLYALTGQRWEADLHLVQLVRLPTCGFKELVLLTDYERRDPFIHDTLLACEAKHPGDPAVRLGLAMEAVEDSDLEEAHRQVLIAVEADPHLGAAQALLGELLLNDGARDEELQVWNAALPESVQDHPGVWYVRGQWARLNGENEIAARCLWECARQLPNSYRAVYQLSLVMNDVQPDVGQELSQRAEQIYEMRQKLSEYLNSGFGNEPALQRVVELLLESGREWEAYCWATEANRRFPSAEWVEPVLQSLSDYPGTDAPRLLDSHNIVARHDLSGYPSHEHMLRDNSATTQADNAGNPATVRFVEQAADLGLDFVYHQGRMAGMVGVRMQESTGGGVGVLDFDLDGLPDLFFTQGEDWLASADAPSPSDQYQDTMFRNRGATFSNVTELARIPIEGGFGQGCSAGDFNNDGFVDVYVANAGVNQLLINLGDGTYHDATAELNLVTSTWTTSCLIADLNADGFPDLFDVNYVEGDQAFRVVCNEHDCSPEDFSSSVDHLYLSAGDGGMRFVDLTDVETGSDGGAGLGIVAFRVCDPSANDIAAGSQAAAAAPSLIVPDANRLCLFIGNDHQPNYFLVNAPSSNEGNLELDDVGYVSGLAVNFKGEPNACMGIASGDANRDGLLDLYVTNYKDEANNMYLQSAGGYFTDAIAATGLLAAGLPYVGWGTQFIDADNNGWLDLVATNGHVGDFEKPDVEYHMPTQFFYNIGGGEFTEVAPESVGPYFAEKRLGRSLATLDWNRDGLNDFVVSNIASPATLLTNETSDAGNFVSLRLHAVSTARDAIGSLVTLITPSGITHQQLTAGDGYQATNERVLRFGIGKETRIDYFVIEWPNGTQQTLAAPPINTVIDIVEGRSQATVWTGNVPAAWDMSADSAEPPSAALQQ